MLRGTSAGLEFVFADRAFDAAWAEIVEKLSERPTFYRGSRAAAIFEGDPPGDETVASFLTSMATHGIDMRGFYGSTAVADLASRVAQPYLGEAPRPSVTSFERKRAARAVRAVDLTEKARSLDADFAGARADIAARRARGEASVPKPVFAPPTVVPSRAVETVTRVPAEPGTLYHRGTVRGGRLLQQVGTIVVVGDVNPGAELVASGDILVFGALRGTAHAGARGDRNARVVALEIAATQLRIAEFIATGELPPHASKEPEVAFVEDGRIRVAPLATLEGAGS